MGSYFPGVFMQLSDKVAPHDKVLTKTIDGEIIVLSLASGHYYKLSSEASTIWDLLKEGVKVSDIRDAMIQTYDAPSSQIQDDLMEVIEMLEREQLIRVSKE